MAGRIFRCSAVLAFLAFLVPCFAAQPAPPKVLALYSTNVERDHVEFARQAITFFGAIARRNHFDFRSSTEWSAMTEAELAQYRVVLWLDDTPHTDAERAAFAQYMQHGGGWLGFHIAGYQSSRAAWPWFADFLGGVFSGNSWPPLPAALTLDAPADPVTHGLPASFLSPANEWYSWSPDPRSNPDIRVLLTLAPSNYPLGFKDTLTHGDIPVVWTNTRYRMLYINMGHGNRIFTSPVQNLLFSNALLRLVRAKGGSIEPARP